MVAAKQPFVVLDPTGAWWGLRSSADGKSPGLPVVILGGQHGDVALERTAGRVVADLVVDEPGYYVIDFSLFESGEAERQFAVDFAERLYRAKGQPGKDFPLHLFVDEADRFIPQQMRKGSNETSPRLLGAFEAIVRRGGLRGLGTTLISQRAAVVNKNVLEMLDVLITLRTVGPNDRKAIEGYVEAHGTDLELKALRASLASLKIGEAWVWEPGAEPSLFRLVQIRQRHTFNSSATPEPGKARVEPRQLAAVDLAALSSRMAETIERAKADDPKELKRQLAQASKDAVVSAKRISELEARVSRASGSSLSNEKAKKEQTILTDADRDAILRLTELLRACRGDIANHAQTTVSNLMNRLREFPIEAEQRAWEQQDRATKQVAERLEKAGFQRILEKLERVTVAPAPVQTGAYYAPQKGNREFAENRPDSARSENNPSKTGGSFRNVDSGPGDASVGNSGLRRMLMALAQRPQGLNRRQLGLRAGLSSRSGTFDTYLSRGRQAGWIDGRTDLRITDAGIAALGAFTPLPEGRELLEHWLGELGESGAARILRALAAAYPRALTRAELGAAANLSDRSGTFDTYLSRLRTLELVEGRGELRASEELFS
jgi:hypothetical protein